MLHGEYGWSLTGSFRNEDMLVDETSGRIKKDALAGSIYADEKWPENDVLGIGQERLQTEGVKSLHEHLEKQAPITAPSGHFCQLSLRATRQQWRPQLKKAAMAEPQAHRRP